MNRNVLILALLGMFVGGLAGCTKSAPDNGSARAKEVVRRGNVEAPQTLDPVLAEDVHSFNILLDLYEGLVAEDAGGNLIPGVAASWSISEDGLHYRFSLRKDARWSNGESVIADDFVRALQRVAAPNTSSTYAVLLSPIKNFSAVKANDMPLDALGVSAVDDRTLDIMLGEPCAYFLQLMSMSVAYPSHGDASNPDKFKDPANFVGNGAYVLHKRPVGGPVLLRRNPQYWDADSVMIEYVEYLAVLDELTEFNIYRTGELDITSSIPSAYLKEAAERLPGQLQIAPSLGLYYLALDLTQPPMDSRALRQALSLSLDREQLAVILGRGEQPAFGIVPPGIANYVGREFTWRAASSAQRLEQAKALYSEAGYTDDNPLVVRFVYDTGNVHEKVALTVADMWRKSLGVEVELDKREWHHFLETRENRDEWQVMRFSWFGDYNDASTFLDIFQSESPQNLSQYQSGEYDKLITAAAREPNVATRMKLLSDAESLLLTDSPIVPLYFYVSKHLVSSDLKGFDQNILDRHPSRFLFWQTHDVKRP